MEQTVFDRLVGVLSSPVQTLRAVSEEQPLAVALGILVLTSLDALITPFSVFGPELGALEARLLSVGITLATGALFFVAIHLLAKMFVSVGTLKGVVSALGFAYFPALLHYPISVLRQTALAPLMGPASLAVSLWVLVLAVIAVRESYDLKTGGAIITLLLAMVTSALAVGLLAIPVAMLLGFSLLS